jgi:hypothetical protein
MPQAEGETFIPFQRIKLTVAGTIVLALAVYGFVDLPDLYAGNIHGRKGQWLLALHPYVRVAFIGLGSFILLIVGGYCAGVWWWPPIRISSSGIQMPSLWGLRKKAWNEITRIEVNGPAIKFYSAETERSRGWRRRMPIMIHQRMVATPISEIVETIARYRPDILQGQHADG